MSAPLHSILSPSSSERWLSCTASVYLTRLMSRAKFATKKAEKDAVWADVEYFMPGQDRDEFFAAAKVWIPDPTSVYAEEGTKAHSYGDDILRGKLKVEDLPKGFEAVKEYTDLCKVLQNRWGGDMWIETRVPLFYYPKEKGTVDNAIFGGDRVCITDYKHGIGVMVEAENNPQLVSYALSLIRYYDEIIEPTPHTKVDIRICQPRTRIGDTVKLWETTVGELEALAPPMQSTADLIIGAMDRSRDPLDLEFVPNLDNCRFCSVKHQCPVKAKTAIGPAIDTEEVEMAFQLLAPEPKNSRFKNISLLSPVDLFKIYQNSKMISAILVEVETRLTELAMMGNPAPGTKLVLGRKGNRKWADEKEVAAKLLEFIEEEEIYEPQSLLSFATIEEKLKAAGVPPDIRKQIDSMTVRSPARSVLALEGDKRPAVGNALDDLMTLQNPEEYAD